MSGGDNGRKTGVFVVGRVVFIKPLVKERRIVPPAFCRFYANKRIVEISFSTRHFRPAADNQKAL